MLRGAILAFAVLVLGSAIYVLGAPSAERDAAEEHAAKKISAAAKARAEASPQSDEPWPQIQPYAPRGPVRQPAADAPEAAPVPSQHLVQTQDEAVAMYEAFLAELANIEGSGKKLSERQKNKLYKDSSNILAGLSMHFDVNDPDQLSYLEGARGMMLAQLRRMKITPPKPPMRKPHQMRGRPNP